MVIDTTHLKEVRLAVIGANKPLIPFYRQAKELGCKIYGFAWAEGAVCKDYCEKFYPISFTEKDRILEICKKEKIDGITSFSLESALPTVIYVAQNLGLISNTEECMSLTKDKFTMRERLKACNVPIPGYRHVSEIKELEGLQLEYPLIVKPSDSGGSKGVTLVQNDEELKCAFNRAVQFSSSRTVMIEEYVDGREFSVEYISCNGKHYFLQITDKVTSGVPYFIELQHHQPADLTTEQEGSIKAAVEATLDALKITDSPSHTELKMKDNGDIRIIELGARMGGDYIASDLVRLSTGYDFVKGNVELVTGHFSQPIKTAHNYSGVYFLSSQTKGKVMPYLTHPQDYPWIVQSEILGANPQLATNNGERSGYLIYQSDKKVIL